MIRSSRYQLRSKISVSWASTQTRTTWQGNMEMLSIVNQPQQNASPAWAVEVVRNPHSVRRGKGQLTPCMHFLLPVRRRRSTVKSGSIPVAFASIQN